MIRVHGHQGRPPQFGFNALLFGKLLIDLLHRCIPWAICVSLCQPVRLAARWRLAVARGCSLLLFTALLLAALLLVALLLAALLLAVARCCSLLLFTALLLAALLLTPLLLLVAPEAGKYGI